MRRYLHLYLLALTAIIGSISAINIVADPLAFFDLVRIESLNVFQAGSEQRMVTLVKPLQIKIRKPDTVFVGASRTHQGINPDSLIDCDLGKVFNLGVGGLGVMDSFALARFAMIHGGARRVFLEMNILESLETLNAGSKLPERMFDPRWVVEGIADTLLSPRVTRNSIEKIYANLAGIQKPMILRNNGWYDKETFKPAKIVRNNDYFLRGTTGRRANRWKKLFAIDDAAAATQRDQGLELTYRGLDEFLIEAETHGTDIVLFIPPVHFVVLAIFDQEGYRSVVENWKKRLADLAVRHGVPLWDFAHHSPVASFDAGTGDNPYFFDFMHFRSLVGRLLVMRMCDLPDSRDSAFPAGGVRLDQIEIEDHLERIREQVRTFPIEVPLEK